jgi:hypothetical protein
MSHTRTIDPTSMAAHSGSESVILHLAALRGSCKSVLSDDVYSKILAIKEACSKSDSSDVQQNQISWRRGMTSHGGGHHGHGQRREGGGGNENQWRSGSSQYTRPTHHNPGYNYRHNSSNNQQQGGGHQRYVSRFRQADAPVAETILNQVILNKLNKFSEQNYEEVKQFLKQILDSDDTTFLKEFMQLVFRKAASEPVFCPLYAQLICELSSQYPSLQKEFEKLYKDYLRIFEDIDETKNTDYEAFVRQNKEKSYRLGYSQFLAELISKGVLQADDLIMLFSKILEQISNIGKEKTENMQTTDEYVQCILRMTRALGNSPVVEHLQCFEEPLDYLVQHQSTEFPGLSKKSVFGLMDCLDLLRKNVRNP